MSCTCRPATFEDPPEFCDECQARYDQEQLDNEFVAKEMELAS